MYSPAIIDEIVIQEKSYGGHNEVPSNETEIIARYSPFDKRLYRYVTIVI